jgi:hypothetical protein
MTGKKAACELHVQGRKVLVVGCMGTMLYPFNG